MPTGDYAADMARVEEYYRSVTPKHPQHATASIVAASGGYRYVAAPRVEETV